jgi:hypothetical protein
MNASGLCRWLPIALSALLASGSIARAAETVEYLREVKPLLSRHCLSCHGPEKPRGGLRLDTAAAVRKGGKEGPVVVPGKPDESPLLAAVLGEGASERMPLNRPPLTPDDIDVLRRWIEQGARAPADERGDASASHLHWAFIPPRRAEPPNVKLAGWCRNPIDRFVLARLHAAGIGPSPEADRATLLRRASLDLTGLPPSPEEMSRFQVDRRPDAYERDVARLMASPHFGERWGRFWLDQARYADSNGFNIDAPRSIWKYRDWVIAALNADHPFDQFVIDQVAGDLHPSASIDQQIATGFHRNTQINQEGGIDVEQFRIESIVDRVNTTGAVFLGLTLGCAQCHDHKYDPISTREYYQLFAFFNNVDEPDLEIASPEALAARDRVRGEIVAFHRELARRYPDLDDRERQWEASVELTFKQAQDALARVAFDSPRDKRTAEQRRALVELMLAGRPEFQQDAAALARLRSREQRFVTTMVVRERSGPPRETCVHLGGDFTRKGERVAPGVPAIFPPLDDSSTGTPPNRLDLARWLVHRRNPLTARVVCNRIWQVYFGRGLVETENDFGTQGTPPSHPELLDWLACELMDNGWSQKHIHSLIVSSATYRQSSRIRGEGKAIDPDNRLLWRQSRLRLDAELIRDSILAASGVLERRIGGPSAFPPQPAGVMTLGQMKREWTEDRGPGRYRRGLYTFLWRATPYPFFTTFDAPGAQQSCTRRNRSNTPLQALTLLNDPVIVDQRLILGLASRSLAARPPSASDQDRLRYSFFVGLGREPLGSELSALEKLFEQENRDDGPGMGASYRSPLKGWIAVARVLFNLDEFVTRE